MTDNDTDWAQRDGDLKRNSVGSLFDFLTPKVYPISLSLLADHSTRQIYPLMLSQEEEVLSNRSLISNEVQERTEAELILMRKVHRHLDYEICVLYNIQP